MSNALKRIIISEWKKIGVHPDCIYNIMKTLVTIVAILCTFLCYGESIVITPAQELAIAIVESNNKVNAIGDRHLRNRAYGHLQIRRFVTADVNRHYGTKYYPAMCLGNRGLSREILIRYLSIYATKKRIGKEPTFEDLARIWNGGPSGWKNPKTVAYWKKVQGFM